MTAVVCAVNVSEGRDRRRIDRLAAAAGEDLLDLHVDPDHHRSVLTLAGEDAVRAVAEVAIQLIDLRRHRGAHPRFGAVDVVPFVPVDGTDLDDAVAARDRYAAWSPVPCLRYGPPAHPSLPELRRLARRGLGGGAAAPLGGITAQTLAHPTAGITAVGARGALVAYNLWLAGESLATARAIAAVLRGPAVRALGLAVGNRVQVSMNLVDPLVFGPADAYAAVAARARIDRAELVGLLPEAVLAAVPEARWAELDLGPDRTVEARLAARPS